MYICFLEESGENGNLLKQRFSHMFKPLLSRYLLCKKFEIKDAAYVIFNRWIVILQNWGIYTLSFLEDMPRHQIFRGSLTLPDKFTRLLSSNTERWLPLECMWAREWWVSLISRLSLLFAVCFLMMDKIGEILNLYISVLIMQWLLLFVLFSLSVGRRFPSTRIYLISN